MMRSDVDILPMTQAAADRLAPLIAATDPWQRLGLSAATITGLLNLDQPDHIQRVITVAGEPVGAIVVHLDWLLGPYLRHLSLVEGARGSGVGGHAIEWLLDLACKRGQRNVWLCVSEFNVGAERFYRRHGFEPAALIDDLVVTGENEILMRRRLTP